MNDFGLYFTLGLEHIVSAGALDHILFICCLAVLFVPADYKKLLILLTAFTVGHSITLFLNIIRAIEIDSYLIEICIPITIIITAAINVLSYKKHESRKYLFQYMLALVFGLVHGLGYASSLRFMLADGDGIAFPLLGFNLGLETGQIFIAAIIVGLTIFCIKALNLKHKYVIILVSLVSALIAFWMVFERI